MVCLKPEGVFAYDLLIGAWVRLDEMEGTTDESVAGTL
jgi:hypothetical protein